MLRRINFTYQNFFFAFLIIVLSSISFYASAQNIRGRVVSSKDSLPLAGVSVRIQQTNAGTTTDSDGKFSIKASSGNVMVVSYLGYQTRIISIASSADMLIALKETDQELDDVVVIGYGTVRKADLTGAVGQVNVEEMQKAPVPTFSDALAGRVTGVQVASNDGQPGSTPNIVIRGAGSLTQNTEPLYVVDGFAMEGFDPGYLSPSDIASITILKDASATAIYGARGANGIVVIETNKGKEGIPVISYDGNMGVNQVTRKMKMMSPYEYVKYQLARWPAEASRSLFPDFNYVPGGPLPNAEIYRNAEGIDWQDRLFRTGITSIHNVSMRGGTSKTKYLVSANAFNQQGTVINTGYDRYQGRLSLDQTINSKLKAAANITYTYIKNYGSLASQNTISGSGMSALFYNVWGYRPVAPPGSNFDDFLIDPDIDSRTDLRINPVVNTQNEKQNRYTTGFLANANLSWKITKDLTLKLLGGLDRKMNKNDYFFNTQTGRGTPLRPGNLDGVQGGVTIGEYNVWSNENTLQYNKKINKNHQLDALAGLSMQGIFVENYGLRATQIPNEELGLSGLDEGLPFSNTALLSDSKLLSYFARFNYNFKNRYLFTATMRADGSSKFAKNNRWAYFPSAAFAWRLGQEKLIRAIPFISDAKVRMSYGLTGNNRVGDFSYLSALRTNVDASYSFNNQQPSTGVLFSDFGNADLKWETTAQADIGIDLSLFANRINITADAYRKVTTDLLLFANMPYVTGFPRAYKNIGKLENTGLEFTLNTINVKSPQFIWESTFNISFNRNKILALNNDESFMLSSVAWDGVFNNQYLYIGEVGGPAAQFIGYIWEGVYQLGDFDMVPGPNGNTYVLKSHLPDNGIIRTAMNPGDIKYRDINGDGTINDKDRTVIGRAMPVHTGGFNNNFSYRNFSLNIFFQWSYGNDIMNANRIFFEGDGAARPLLNQYATYADYWTFDNPSNKYFGTNNSSRGPSGVYSSRTIEDGSFLRLKTIALGYNFPEKFTSKMKIKGLVMNISAQNLYTWTKYSGMDPEVSVRHSVLTPGLDFSPYPRSRTIVLGVKASF